MRETQQMEYNLLLSIADNYTYLETGYKPCEGRNFDAQYKHEIMSDRVGRKRCNARFKLKSMYSEKQVYFSTSFMDLFLPNSK